MIVIGIDAHKRSHTAVAVDGGTGQHVAEATVAADDLGHQKLLAWAEKLDPERRWAIEDCRNVSRRLEASLLRAGEVVCRVPPKMMAGQRDAARSFGKSDPIDALAVAHARCAARTYRSRGWRARSARSRCCSTIAATSSSSAPAMPPACAGWFTSSTQR